MSTNTILADRTTYEVEALALEIFSTTYGCDWGQAIDEALATVTQLATYARAWDQAITTPAATAGDWNTAFAALPA